MTQTTNRTTNRTWTVTVGAAAVVAALLLTVWWLAQPPTPASGSGAPGPGAGATGGGSTGGGPTGAGTTGSPGSSGGEGPVVVDPGGEDPGAGGAEPLQPLGRDPVLAEGGVRIDSYVVRGHRLLLNYTTGVPECYGEVALGEVRELRDRVTVALRSVPPADPAEVCIDLAVTGTLAVDLEERVGQRLVVDGSYDPIVLVARVERPYAAPSPGTTAD